MYGFLFIVFIVLFFYILFQNPRNKVKHDNTSKLMSENPQLFYDALVCIYNIRNTSNYDIFSSNLSNLKAISNRLLQYCSNPNFKKDKEEAVEHYKQSYGISKIGKWQNDFIEEPDLTINHSLIAKLEARFFIDYCEQVHKEIAKMNDEILITEKKDEVKKIAEKFIYNLKTHNHVTLAMGIARDARLVNVIIDTNEI